MTLKDVGFDPLLKAVGKVVQEKRQSLGISQEELARRSKLHRTYISDVERGSRSVSLITLVKLAEALDTNVSVLVETAESRRTRNEQHLISSDMN
jgi:transcriptional regulator with XRE-family HTH domain